MCPTTIAEAVHPEFASPRWQPQWPAAMDSPDPEPPASHRVMASGPAVQIRPFQLGDALPMYQAARESLDQLCAWMTWCGTDYSPGQAESFVAQCARAWQRGEHYSFAIIDAQDNTFLGSVGLNRLDSAHKFANVGYWVRNSAAGRGVATLATRSVVAFGLTELGLNRLEFLIPTINVASQRVAQKVGAKFEGVLRNRLMISGRSHDAAMYSLVKAR